MDRIIYHLFALAGSIPNLISEHVIARGGPKHRLVPIKGFY
jgi:hypothetical protein